MSATEKASWSAKSSRRPPAARCAASSRASSALHQQVHAHDTLAGTMSLKTAVTAR